jgi:hypothetical protein
MRSMADWYLPSMPGNRDGAGASGTRSARPQITTMSPPPGPESKFSATWSLVSMCRCFAPSFRL